MLATQLNTIATTGALQRNGIIRITKSVTNNVANKRILIVLALEVLTPDAGMVIGAQCASLMSYVNV
jgi:replication factor A1